MGQTFPVFRGKFDMGPLQYKGAFTLFSMVISANIFGRMGNQNTSDISTTFSKLRTNRAQILEIKFQLISHENPLPKQLLKMGDFS
jgi:hypothetical protein